MKYLKSAIVFLILGAFLAFFANTSRQPSTVTSPSASPNFSYVEVDSTGPRAPWGKAVGDINGDGLTDIVVGGHQRRRQGLMIRIARKLGIRSADESHGELIWYAAPDWEKAVVSTEQAIRTDVETGDIDLDGLLDIIALTDTGLGWYRNPDWHFTLIDERKLHDVELANIDDDPDLEIVTRSQSLFGYNNGNSVTVYDRNRDGTWLTQTLPVPHGEGLLVTDINSDGRSDIIVNNVGYYNELDDSHAIFWQLFEYAPDWNWNDVFVGAGDFDGDGHKDIILSPSEPVDQHYRISWFRAPGAATESWQEEIVVENVEAILHSIGTGDFDRDGRTDFAIAEMTQGADPDEVAVYFNLNAGSAWRKETLAVSGSHSMRIFDADGDFDLDIFGANWEKRNYSGDYSVDLWINHTADAQQQPTWSRHVVDDDRPGQATFVYSIDIDGDDQKDLVTGAWWYRNPGTLGAMWKRLAIGEGANNVALIEDFDRDGKPDLLASSWRGYRDKPSIWQKILNRTGLKLYDYSNAGNKFVWARNLGDGKFEIHQNIEDATGDFLQGADVLKRAENRFVLLSWHSEETSLQALRVPEDPLNDTWAWSELSPHSQNEELTAADLDGDDLEDIVMGTEWIRQTTGEPATWQHKVIQDSSALPDRHRVVDLNSDGRNDIVVGYEAVSKIGKLVWYEAKDVTSTNWEEHKIADLIGPMSLDVADMDGDGDFDIVVGEHNLDNPETARIVWIENFDGAASNWITHLIYMGDEHHDGAQTVDIDSDGDLDVISVGWSHNRVLIYENLSQ